MWPSLQGIKESFGVPRGRAEVGQGSMGLVYVEDVGSWVMDGVDSVEISRSLASSDKLLPANIVLASIYLLHARWEGGNCGWSSDYMEQ